MYNEYYRTNIGIIHQVVSRNNGYVKTEGLGLWDFEDGSLDERPIMGFVVAEHILAHMVENGLTPVVRLGGNVFVPESEYLDGEASRQETRVENTFEELQRKTRRGRKTLNAY